MRPARPLLLALLSVACSDGALKTVNSSPTADVTSHADGDTVRARRELVLEGFVGDSNHGAESLTVAWRVGGEAVCAESRPDSAGRVTCAVSPEAGALAVDLTAVDPDGATATDRVTLTVAPLSPPTVSITPPTTDLFADEDAVLDALVADEEDPADTLVVVWETDVAGVLAHTGPDVSGATRFVGRLDAGPHQLTVTVTDADGLTASDTLELGVGVARTPPTCAWSTPGPGDAVSTTGATRLEASVGDADQPPETLAVSIDSAVLGPLGTPTPDASGAVSLSGTTFSVGPDTLTLTVTDDRAETCTATLELVGSAPPTVVFEVPDPGVGGVVAEGAAAELQVRVADDLDAPDTLSIVWETDLDGVFATTTADASGLVAVVDAARSRGAHTVSATVTDSQGQSATATAGLVVNGVPGAPTVTLSPDPADTTDDLTALATGAIDPDGDPVTYTYAWTRDGSAVSTTGATIAAADTARGQSWTVTVTPSDGTHTGPTGTATLVVGNAVPEVGSPTLSPGTPGTDDTLTATASATDADADAVSLTYAWAVDSGAGFATVQSGTLATLDGGTHFDKGDQVRVTVTADDGTDTASATSAAVTVGNTAPEVAAVVVSPSAPTGLVDDLLCTATATDADGDPVTVSYAWDNGGVAFSGATTTVETGDTVPAADTDHAETWTCTVTPDDGTDTGASATDLVETWCYGDDALCPGVDCADILAADPTAADGLYWIDPDGAGAFETHCDMTTDSGGWTLVASFVNTDGTVSWAAASTLGSGSRDDHVGNYGTWLTATPFGTAATRETADHKGEAYSRLAGEDLLLMSETGGWLSFDDALPSTDLLSHVSSFSTCQTSPVATTAVAASNTTMAGVAYLSYYGVDPNHLSTCPLSAYSSTSSSVIGIYHEGCATYGLGSQIAGGAIDTMASLSPNPRVGVSGCGDWRGHTSVLSAYATRDDATMLYVR